MGDAAGTGFHRIRWRKNWKLPDAVRDTHASDLYAKRDQPLGAGKQIAETHRSPRLIDTILTSFTIAIFSIKVGAILKKPIMISMLRKRGD